MPSNIFPMGKNDRVLKLSYKVSNSIETEDIVPYVFNGKSYTLKIVRHTKGVNRPFLREINKRNNADPNILGYANMRKDDFFPDDLYVLPDETIQQFHFKNGYFEQVNRGDEEGDYEIRIQLYMSDNNKIRELYHTYNFVAYPTPLKNENILRMNKEKQEEEEREAREKRASNEDKMKELMSAYVMNSNDIRVKSSISTVMYTWPELNREIIVFRGQSNPMVQEIRTRAESFFSTSLDWWLANQQFTSEKDQCCLFVIRAQPGVKYYSTVGEIEDAIRKYNNVRAKKEGAENVLDEQSAFEEEVLLEGNGQFYQDKEKTRPGFRELTAGELVALGIEFGERPMRHQQSGKTVNQTTGVFEAYYFPRTGTGTGTETETEVYQGVMIGNSLSNKGGKRRTRKQKQKKRRNTRRQ